VILDVHMPGLSGLDVPAGTDVDPSHDVAISSSIHMSQDTHVEFVTYGPKGDLVSLIFTLIAGDRTLVTRPLKLLVNIVRHPLQFARTLPPFGWGRRTVVFLVMQSLDNAIAFHAKRRWFRGGVSLTTEQDPEKPNPTYIDAGNKAAEWLAKRTGGLPQTVVLEAVANIPTTAHILGGAVIGADASTGVVDRHNRVFGYQNLLVCDGAAMPANPGVNPSLTITAIAENAMSHIPATAVTCA